MASTGDSGFTFFIKKLKNSANSFIDLINLSYDELNQIFESLKTEDWQENLDKVEAFKLIKSSCDQSRNWKDLQGFALNDNELSEENLDAFLDLLSRDPKSKSFLHKKSIVSCM